MPSKRAASTRKATCEKRGSLAGENRTNTPYLEAIAGADGEVSADEAALLQRVHSRLALDPQLAAA